MTWARLGCLVLVMDQLGHGERRQHPFVSAQSYAGEFPVGRQDYHFRYNTGIQLHLIGDSLALDGWDVWRGVDLLLSRHGIDPKRIVLMGSVAGGGDPAASRHPWMSGLPRRSRSTLADLNLRLPTRSPLTPRTHSITPGAVTGSPLATCASPAGTGSCHGSFVGVLPRVTSFMPTSSAGTRSTIPSGSGSEKPTRTFMASLIPWTTRQVSGFCRAGLPRHRTATTSARPIASASTRP